MKKRAYVILTLPKPNDMSYEDYVEHRRYQLSTYCEGCAVKIPVLREVVGIAIEPYVTKTVSVDYLLMTKGDQGQCDLPPSAVPTLQKSWLKVTGSRCWLV